MKQINFGISGSEIIVKENSLIKKSSDIQRFKKQIEKQVNFKDFLIFKAPKIFSFNFNKNILECEMEYIEGSDCINYFYLSEKSTLDNFTQNLICYIETNINNSKYAFVDKSVFFNKINSINIESILKEKIINYIASLKDESLLLPIGNCHGDLTFTNMIFYDKTIYLIDFLDSFLETSLQDIVKVRQETNFFWSVLQHKLKNDGLNYNKVITSYLYIDNLFDEHFKKFIWYKKYYNLFQIINLARILPYNKNDFIKLKICSKIEQLLEER